MDQIFERLERLVKAWVNSGMSDSQPRGQNARRNSYGDPDLDAAMAELDDFLDTSKTETEKREAESARAQAQREQRARQEQSRRYASGNSTESTTTVIEEAYRYMGLKPYTPFAEVKATYKKLLFKYHPDRNSSSPEAHKKATETSTKINAAYQIIETYEESRK